MDISKLSFLDFIEPEEEACHLLLIGMIEALSSAGFRTTDINNLETVADCLDDAHLFFDVYVMNLMNTYPSVQYLNYIFSHDGDTYKFVPGNTYTLRVSSYLRTISLEKSLTFDLPEMASIVDTQH